MTRTSKIFALAVVAAILPAGSAASAQSHSEPMSVEVGYADLNLLNDEGVERLDQRLETAINTVCGRTAQTNIALNLNVRRCQRETLADVTPARDSAIEAARTGRRGTVDIARLIVKRHKSGK